MWKRHKDSDDSDEENELLIDEDKGQLAEVIDQATDDTIGGQALKELRKDFEKAGLFKKEKKSLLCEDYKKILNKAGELIKFIRTIKSHPDRIHPELWYNELKMANDGPLCRCRVNQQKGINHGVYPNEEEPKNWHESQLYHYRIALSPKTNFDQKVNSWGQRKLARCWRRITLWALRTLCSTSH